MKTKQLATVYATAAAALYAINIPLSKLLLAYVAPTMMAAFLYLGAGAGLFLYSAAAKAAGALGDVAFDGGGDVRASLYIDILPLWLSAIPLAALLGLVLKVPLEIFCLYLLAENLSKTPLGIWRFRSGKWIHDVTVE